MQAFDFEKNIAVLASAKGQPIPWPAGPYPAYSVDILALAQSYFRSAEFDRNFDRILRQHGFHEGVPEAVVAEIAATSEDYDLVRAVLSAIIRGEKYTPGMWQVLVENGILLDLMTRAYQLKEKSEIKS